MTVTENRKRGHYVKATACDWWLLGRVDDDRPSGTISSSSRA